MMIEYKGLIGKNAGAIKSALDARVTLIQKPSVVDCEENQFGGGTIRVYFAAALSANDEVDLDLYMSGIGYE